LSTVLLTYFADLPQCDRCKGLQGDVVCEVGPDDPRCTRCLAAKKGCFVGDLSVKGSKVRAPRKETAETRSMHKRHKKAKKSISAPETGLSTRRTFVGIRPPSVARSSVQVWAPTVQDVQDLVDRSDRGVDLALKDADDEVDRLESRLAMVQAALDAVKMYREDLRRRKSAA
jgi:hypothetical protein